MKISIANDHNGVLIKNTIKEYLENLGYEVIDFGSNDNMSVDYPNFAFKVGKSVASKDTDLGILICGTGIGMSIACNKVRGIRCAKVANVEEAKLSKQHNNANVIALSSHLSDTEIKEIVKSFVETDFSNEERHIRRNGLIDNYRD
mgnify:CR=1 FL=1